MPTRFDGVNMGNDSIRAGIRRYRLRLVEQLQQLIADGEAQPTMTVAELITSLQKEPTNG